MAKVKIVESATEFFAVLEKSGILSASELESAKTICSATEDPKQAARRLLAENLVTQWQATQLLAGFAGLVMGKYELLDVLSKTQFGRVYLAEHVTMGQKVSLHTLSMKNVSDTQLVERFLNEARAASLFEHRNVIRVLDMTSEGDRHFVVTENVAGEDLQQRVEKKGPLPATEAARLVRQAAEGLAYIHQKGILHRDLKPASLLVDARGVVKILDVGMGQLRQVESTEGESSGAILLSRLSFVSPEQARGQELDVRSDVYALGGVLYFLVSGRAPYIAATDEERETVNNSQRPLPIASLCQGMPLALCDLCERMMAPRPEDRPESMPEVASTLRSILEASAPTAEEPSPVQTVGTSPSAPAQVTEAPVAGRVAVVRPEEDSGSRFVAAENVSEEPQESEGEEFQFHVQRKGRPAQEESTTSLDDAPVDLGLQTRQREVKTPSVERARTPQSAQAISRQQHARMLLVIAGLAIALLILVTGAIVALVMQGNGKEVASNTSDSEMEEESAVQEEEAIVEADAGSADAEVSPVEEPAPAALTSALQSIATSATPAEASGTSPAAKSNSTPASATPSSPLAAIPPPAATASPSTAFGSPSSPPPTPTASPMTPLPATAAAVAPAPTSPAPTTPSPTTPAPENSPKSEEKKSEPAKPEPAKPEPAKPDPAPSEPTVAAKAEVAPAPPTGPTFQIASAVELPPLTADGGSASGAPNKVLGVIQLDEKAGCFIALVGGDRAMKGKTDFSLRSARGGTAPRDWEFLIREANEAETILATLSLAKNQLTFAWTPEGQKHPSSPYLQNCAIKITVGQEKPHIVSLRKPVEAPPSALAGLEKSAVTVKIAVEALPEPSALRFEPKVADVKLTADSEGPGESGRGDQWLYVGDAGAGSILHLKLATSTTAKGVQVTLTPYLVLPNEKPQRLTPALKKSLPAPAVLEEEKLRVKKRVEELAKLPNDQGKVEIGVMDVRSRTLDETITKLKQFEEVLQKLAAAQLQLRVYYDAVDAQIDLVRPAGSTP